MSWQVTIRHGLRRYICARRCLRHTHSLRAADPVARRRMPAALETISRALRPAEHLFQARRDVLSFTRVAAPGFLGQEKHMPAPAPSAGPIGMWARHALTSTFRLLETPLHSADRKVRPMEVREEDPMTHDPKSG